MFLEDVSVRPGILGERNAQGIDARRMLTRPVSQTCVIDEYHLHSPTHLTVVGWRRRGPSDRIPHRTRDI
jgi:hypothetical protein